MMYCTVELGGMEGGTEEGYCILRDRWRWKPRKKGGV